MDLGLGILLWVIFIVLYVIVIYYLVNELFDRVAESEKVVNKLGPVNLKNDESIYLGVISGLASTYDIDVRLTQILSILLWLQSPTVFLMVYVLVYGVIAVANKRYEKLNTDDLGGEVAVTYTDGTPDVVTAVEDPYEGDSYRDTVVGQVNEELSKITDVKIDTSKTPIEVSDGLDEYFNEKGGSNTDESDTNESDTDESDTDESDTDESDTDELNQDELNQDELNQDELNQDELNQDESK